MCSYLYYIYNSKSSVDYSYCSYTVILKAEWLYNKLYIVKHKSMWECK